MSSERTYSCESHPPPSGSLLGPPPVTSSSGSSDGLVGPPSSRSLSSSSPACLSSCSGLSMSSSCRVEVAYPSARPYHSLHRRRLPPRSPAAGPAPGRCGGPGSQRLDGAALAPPRRRVQLALPDLRARGLRREPGVREGGLHRRQRCLP